METTLNKIGEDSIRREVDDKQTYFEGKINQYADENGEIDTEIALRLLTEMFKNV